MENETETPAAIAGIEKFLNNVVTVTAKDGRKFRGKLTQHDEHMNLVMEDVEEVSKEGQVEKFKLILLKGGNVSDISI